MQLWRHFTNLPDAGKGAVLAIGNFDGVHRGHQEIVAQAAAKAAELNRSCGILTFEPHPRLFFAPQSAPFRLTPFRLKARLIEALGADHLFVLAFDKQMAGMEADAFVRDVLADGLGVGHVMVGDDFRFGKGRKGDIALLKTMGDELGFGVTSVDQILSTATEAYSSTLVRYHLEQGNPTRAALLLGRYWEIEGRVQTGHQRGRHLGFPTANIALDDILRPAFGVYAVRACIDTGKSPKWHSGVANLGVRPTVDGGNAPLLEVHLFDFSGDIYGQHLRVALVDFLRPEQKFDGLDALKAQIAEDSKRAKVTLEMEDWQASWPASPYMAPARDFSEE
ncbi:MAG: bifunctional riboflavin kinase/FAD synthetase [Pseudomonadota bacterium]